MIVIHTQDEVYIKKDVDAASICRPSLAMKVSSTLPDRMMNKGR